ncbi:MAG: alpha/beta fold hydrolase [Solirubrobacteraceae bacterium]
MDTVLESIPGARLRIIPGGGHAFFLEREDETLESLTGFLGRARQPSRCG